MRDAMGIDAKTRVYGLIGDPVKHSYSPQMQTAAFQRIGWNAIYLAFEVPPQRLRQGIDGVRAFGIQGLNVTIPHKETIIPLLDEITPEVKLIGAVNTVVRDHRGRLIGYNTDGMGFLASLRWHVKWDPRGKRVALIGAGGAGKAIGVALAKAGMRALTLHDRALEKAEAMAKQLRGRFHHVRVSVARQPAQLQLRQQDLLVNATPVGMSPADPLLIEPQQLHRHLIVYDLIYNPPETPLVREARARSVQAINGFDLLIRQGVESFKLWTHTRMDVEPVMRQAVGPLLEQRILTRPQPWAKPKTVPHPSPGRRGEPRGRPGEGIDITTQAGRLRLMELERQRESRTRSERHRDD